MLDIQASGTSPRVLFDEIDQILLIEGESYPENSFSFYEPVFDWFQQEFPKYKKFQLQVNISYMNSSSTKCLLDILDILNEAGQQGKKVSVTWFYEKDNHRSLELAEEFKEDMEIPFHIEAYVPN